MVRNSGGRLRFCVKAHQSITHTRDAEAETYRRLHAALAPLREAGMLGPLLLQFPFAFRRTPANRRYLQEVVARCEGFTLAVEFRHDSWDLPEVAEAFRAAGLTLVSVDYPPLAGLPKPQLKVTGEIAYLRLHGRNAERWFSAASAAERHDYRYSPSELAFWVDAILAHRAELTQVYLMLQNTTKGHALANLAMLEALFAERGL